MVEQPDPYKFSALDIEILRFCSPTEQHTINEYLLSETTHEFQKEGSFVAQYKRAHRVFRRLTELGVLTEDNSGLAHTFKRAPLGDSELNHLEVTRQAEEELQAKRREALATRQARERQVLETELTMIDRKGKQEQNFIAKVKEFVGLDNIESSWLLKADSPNPVTVAQQIVYANDHNQVCEIPYSDFAMCIGSDAETFFVDDPREAFRMVKAIIFQFLKKINKESCFKLRNDGHFVLLTGMSASGAIPTVLLGDLKTEFKNKLVAVSGRVSSADTNTVPVPYEVIYGCPVCNMETRVQFSYPELPPKTKVCTNPECSPNNRTRQNEMFTEDRFVFSIEQDEEEAGESEVKGIGCVFQPHLCQNKYLQIASVLGTQVKVIGILRERETFNAKEKNPTKAYKLWLDVISFELENRTWGEITYTPEEEKEFEEFAKKSDEEVKGTWFSSFVPALSEKVDFPKEALLLSIIGGTKLDTPETRTADGKLPPQYEDKPPHILFVGSAGTGKSDLIEGLADVAPKVKMATGGMASGAGLTASAVRNEETGNWQAQAGLAVHAHNGILAIDELTETPKEELGKLRQLMASGLVRLIKSHIEVRFAAKCTMVAGCNPKGGAFDYSQDLVSQINLDSPLRSRFSIIIFMFGIRTRTENEQIARLSLGEGLHTRKYPPKPLAWWKKYISYAKKKCTNITFPPQVKNEYYKLADVMYAKSVEAYGMTEGEATSAREHAQFRILAQANAKLHLRNEVTATDLFEIKRFTDKYLDPAIDINIRVDKSDLYGRGSSEKRSELHLFEEAFTQIAFDTYVREKGVKPESVDRKSSVIKFQLIDERELVNHLMVSGLSEEKARKFIKEKLSEGSLMAPRENQLKRVW